MSKTRDNLRYDKILFYYYGNYIVQLTRFTDYALRVLMHLGHQNEGTRSQIAPLAEMFHVPRTHMMKVIHHLGKAGWVTTFQGRGGGFCLGIAPDQNVKNLVTN